MDRFHRGRLLNSCGCECFKLRRARRFSLLFHYCGANRTFHYSYAEFLKKAQQAAILRDVSVKKSAKIIPLDEAPITERYSLINVHGGVTFQKTGDKLTFVFSLSESLLQECCYYCTLQLRTTCFLTVIRLFEYLASCKHPCTFLGRLCSCGILLCKL